jgi:nitrogen-specific signal transduction histidine kinase
LFSDNGPGIPAELADRVLDPFFSGRQGGQGMGLAIARNILTAHGGSIEVVVDGRRNGANIRVTLPISSRRS